MPQKPKKLDTNAILRGMYAADTRFSVIARWVAAQQFTSESALREAVVVEFPVVKQTGMRKECVHIGMPQAMWGVRHSEYGDALAQMEVAARLPVAVEAAMMPDAHVGYALPIGGVITLNKAISPSFVGVDIGCGMTLVIMSGLDKKLSMEQVQQRMMQSTCFGSEAVFGDGIDRKEDHLALAFDWSGFTEHPVLRTLLPKAKEQLGTSGGGNHFVSLLSWGLVYGILVHSGSRGVGKKFADHYIRLARAETSAKYSDIPHNYEWLDFTDDQNCHAMQYLRGVMALRAYASLNRRLIAKHVIQALGADADAGIDCVHNTADFITSEHIRHYKGAVPLIKDHLGIVASSCADPVYIVSGRGDKSTLEACSHGAGRRFSRKEAKLKFNKEQFDDAMRGILHHGIGEDETPLAYRQINDVLTMQSDVVKQVAALYPKIVLMGGYSSSEEQVE